MPQTPSPAGQFLGNHLARTAATAHGASIVKAPLLSTLSSSAEYPNLFAPSTANSWQQPTGSSHPTVTATIGASGQAIIMASSTAFISGAPMVAIIAYSYTWTPQGGSPTTVGPNEMGSGTLPNTELARCGYNSGSGGLPLWSTISGVQTVSGLPQSAQVQFDLWYMSSIEAGAEFNDSDLTVIPM